MNEEAPLGSLLDGLRLAPGVHEIIVSDGGFSDRTAALVRPPHRLVRSEPGRGQQLRTGAEAATGDALLFPNADVLPPWTWRPRSRAPSAPVTSAATSVCATRMGGRSDAGLSGSRPSTYRRKPRYYGDSGIFARRDAYDACGGFPYVPIMEDVIFVRAWGPPAGPPTCRDPW